MRNTNQLLSSRSAFRTLLVLLTLCVSILTAQENDDALPLIEREPFDRITLDEENGSAQIEVFPIASIDRSSRLVTIPTLTIRRLEDPADIQYSVRGNHIARVELFPFILFEEANRLISQRQMDEAYYYVERLNREFPNIPGIRKLNEEFFYQDAGSLFKLAKYDEALQALDQVNDLNPARAASALDSVLQRIIVAEYKAGNFESVRNKLVFARRKYNDATNASLKTWETRLQTLAEEKLKQARTLLEKGDPSKAMRSLREAKDIWPTTAGIPELNSEILQKYPRVRIAVTQRFAPTDELDVSDTYPLNWATRRLTPLLSKELVTLRDFTADGAQYDCPIGKLSLTPNRRQIDLTLDPTWANRTHAFARSLLRLADPEEATFSPRWAEYLQSIYMPATDRIEIQLTRATLRPEGLLPRTVPASLASASFSRTEEGDGQTQVLRSINDTTVVRELSETLYDPPNEATRALLNGSVDVIDRIYPADATRLGRDDSIRLVPYRVPTIHGLVFNDREPLLRDSTFRRGILYGINRQGFVDNDLNSPAFPETGRVLSGFAPAGLNGNDPLGYAYDTRIKPREYNPPLSVVLMRLAIQQRQQLMKPEEQASDQPTVESTDETETPEKDTDQDNVATEPEFPELVLAFPDSPVAVSACSLIATDLQRVGVKVRLRQLEAGQGRPSDDSWDILYIETSVEEPLVDLPNLILDDGILGRHGGLVWQATRRLQESANISEVRDQFMRIHKLTFDHTPMLPLWQVIEHAAVADTLRGPGGDTDGPLISLYDNVSDWRLGP